MSALQDASRAAFFICRSFLQREGDGAHQDGGERLLAGAS